MDLKRQTAHALLFAGASTSGGIILRLAQLAILARLLAPADFGMMAMVLVALGLLSTIIDLGLSNAIIAHRSSATHEQLSTLYWLTLATGIVAAIGFALAAPFVAIFFDEPRLTALIQLASPVLILLPAGQQFRIMLHRELRFGLAGAVELIGIFVGAVAAIVLAARGVGVIALVAGHLVMTAVQSFGFMIMGCRSWRPRLVCRPGSLRSWVSFGGLQAGERLVLFFVGHIDYIIIGRLLGPEVLGVYRIAYELAAVPHRRINQIVARVTLPALARRTDDVAALRRAYATFIRWLSIAVVPLSVGLVLTAGPAVHVLFGEAWADAVPLVAILALVGLGKGLLSPSGAAMLARQRPDVSFMFNTCLAITCATVFMIVAPLSGVVGVAVAYVVITAIAFVLINGWLLPRLIGLTMHDQFREMAGPLLASGVMSVAVSIVLRLTDAWTMPGQLISSVVIGGVTYVAALLVLRRDLVREVMVLGGTHPRATPQSL